VAADRVTARGSVDGSATSGLVLASAGGGFDVIGIDGSRGTERARTSVIGRLLDSGKAVDGLGDGVVEALAE